MRPLHIPVTYAAADPMVNSSTVDERPPSTSNAFLYLSFGMAAVIPLLQLFSGKNRAWGNRLVFVAISVCLTLAGYLAAGRIPIAESKTYTLQTAEAVMAGISIDASTAGVPGRILINQDGLKVGNVQFGQLPNHAHVWVQPGRVMVNGKTVAASRGGLRYFGR